MSYLSKQGKAILGLSLAMYVIGGAATGLAGYTFFFIFPVADYNMTQAANQMKRIADDVHRVANSIPCGDPGGCSIDLPVLPPFTLIDLSSVKSRVMNIGNAVDSLSSSVISFRDTLFYGLVVLIGLGLAVIFGAVGLSIVGRTFQQLNRLLANTARTG